MQTAEQMASALEADRDFRILRRVPPVEQWKLAQPANDVVRGVVVDCETTGLGESDEVIELGAIPFSFDKASGQVVGVHINESLSGFCEPERPISPESTAIHGITQEMVTGHTIADAEVARTVGDAKLIIAFNSQFDRRMTGKTWPLLDALPWGCAYVDVDWRSLGLESGKLQFLLMKLGWFFDGHRAFDDALATLFLLTQPGVLSSLLETARKPLFKVKLVNTPYSAKDAIKARGGYQWDDHVARGKSWWKTTNDPVAESDWFKGTIDRGDILIKALPLTARHSSKLVEL